MSVARDVSEAALLILRAVAAAADAFPPLKSAAGGALHIVDLIQVRFHPLRSSLLSLISIVLADSQVQ